MIEITRGTVKQGVCADIFCRLLNRHQDMDGVCYIGYPICLTADGPMPLDALLVLPSRGIVVVHFEPGVELPAEYKETMDDAYNKLKSRLQGCKALVQGRKLGVDLTVVTYAPTAESVDDELYPVCNDDSFITFIYNLVESDDNRNRYRQALSSLQAISTLRNGTRKRQVAKEDSRGAKLQNLERSISTLDHRQSKAVIETVDGVQRIRGLAGSGKTVVLALKAAYLHGQHPEWKICVTFHTRSLKDQFKRLITAFVIESTGNEPDWDNLKIIHAWGSGLGEREGVYYNFCVAEGVPPMDYAKAKYLYNMSGAFAGACRDALARAGGERRHAHYDVILVDEAQDLPVEFLRICYEMLCEPKRLVYAYDELQSLTQSSLPPPEEIFGKNDDGQPRVVINSASQDITLGVCYRNSRPVLTTAHALGFGIYRQPDQKTGTGLIQIFEDKSLWTDVGYAVESGRLEDGSNVALKRTEDTSPNFLESDLDVDDMIVFKKFDTEKEQAEWVVSEIAKNISVDELRHDDILVINTDPLSTNAKTGLIRAMLLEAGINAHLVGVDTTPDVFFSPSNNSIAFSGIFRAKGNEAGMVYVINAQDCYASPFQLSTVRNRLFTAITRSKAWVRVLGVGDGMQGLIEEFKRVKSLGFKLEFNYPDAELRKQLKIVNRDRSLKAYSRLKDVEKSIVDIFKALQSGEIQKEDLSPEMLDELKNLLG